jgi:peptide/nickel transport system ATP-binding protein
MIPLLRINDLRVSIQTDAGRASILDGIDLTLQSGRILGVVGESGCGKSTLIRSVMGILAKGARVDSGEILFEGENLLVFSETELNDRIRSRRIGFIPQDPLLSLNPVFKVGTQLLEIMRDRFPTDGLRGSARQRAQIQQLVTLLDRMHVPDPEQALERYPHQFSGGQRQRLLIAAALACSPALVIADEPTTALDVTTQHEILILLRELVAEFNISLLFVTHDFGVVAELCDDLSVIYAGQSVESGSVSRVLSAPAHPYTRALLACHPDRAQSFRGIPGTVPSPLHPPPGCRFAPRCADANARCATPPPAVRAPSGAMVKCVLHA